MNSLINAEPEQHANLTPSPSDRGALWLKPHRCKVESLMMFPNRGVRPRTLIIIKRQRRGDFVHTDVFYESAVPFGIVRSLKGLHKRRSFK